MNDSTENKTGQQIEKWQLAFRQNLPLKLKIAYSIKRIKNWYEHFDGQVYVSFSGGKDSTVLLHLARSIYPNIEGVFVDTGLEYPEIRDFIKQQENITWLKPAIRFDKVIEKYGYPVISKENSQKIYEIKSTKSEKLKSKRLHGDDKGNGKLSEKWQYLLNHDIKIGHQCCNVLKKRPVKNYEKLTGKKPIVGTMANESSLRKTNYLKSGCNSFNGRAMSQPIAFWSDKDIWEYMWIFGLEYSGIYDKGYDRTGCMFCMFGVHLEENPNRFERMKQTHPNNTIIVLISLVAVVY